VESKTQAGKAEELAGYLSREDRKAAGSRVDWQLRVFHTASQAGSERTGRDSGAANQGSLEVGGFSPARRGEIPDLRRKRGKLRRAGAGTGRGAWEQIQARSDSTELVTFSGKVACPTAASRI
jgi:ribosomal protein L27